LVEPQGDAATASNLELIMGCGWIIKNVTNCGLNYEKIIDPLNLADFTGKELAIR
jgi:hypothetical protein